ncbi:MAG: Hpt domain-containing protein [Betaproteobacteria bacterium]|nr:Hpt domain-containing protein [Betaproteobacteria bacterium]
MGNGQDELDPKLLPVFLAEAAELLPRIAIGLSQIEQGLADAESLLRLQRSLHTLKGTARMTGALALGETVHRIELQAKALAAGDAADAAAMRADYQAALRQIETLQALPAATMPAEMADDENPEASIESLLGRLQRVADQAALDLRKQAHLQCQDNAVYLERRLLGALAPALEHLVRNAVAHGIELPERRRASGKPAAGEIELASVRTVDGVTIHVADDGAGIDPALIERIFEPGFSTVQEANHVAGMGIGLDAVRAVVEELGGRVSVQSQPGQGARFSVFLPA